MGLGIAYIGLPCQDHQPISPSTYQLILNQNRKTMKKRLNFGNVLFNMLVALLFSAACGIAALPAVGASLVTGTVLSYMDKAPGMLFAGVQKEIWTDMLLEGFYPGGSFLSEARDLSALVDFNTINLAEAGASPSVLIDNTSYPIATSSRTDTAKTLALKTLDTTSTIVRNVEEMEAMYDKMASVIYGHKMELQRTAIKLAAWNFAPASDATLTPVIAASGTLTNGYRKLTFANVLDLMKRFNLNDIPEEGRILVLNPNHEADLIEADLALYKAAMASNTLFGFKLFRTSATPVFTASTGVKCAYGAAAAPSTDTYSSFAFQKDEVMKAMGTVEMFAKYKDPDQKGDVINFQMRFAALPLRTKAIAALYSPRA